MSAEERKRQGAVAALTYLPKSGVVGLGTGSTMHFFIEEVGRLVRQGRALTGVPTSERSRTQAAGLGIPLLDPRGPWAIDVTVDGADEVDAALNLIKGGGGAHAREKIVNQASKRNVIVVDESKLSSRLGERWPVPVEVLEFGHRATAGELAKLGAVSLRLDGKEPVRSDAGNLLYDLAIGPIEDPAALDQSLRAIPGVVETGLFVQRADIVLVASASGVRELRRA